ncbi:hypothetical protein BD779DRAFT_1528725 [Infundibulicybe gibba]|nr:hypothetical protein BD779DRAFT_1528725 [Infundibulicybe gibba]
MSCGMLPSSPDSLGPGTSRRRVPSLQRIEQGKLGSGESRPQVGYLTPFSFDSHLNNSHQQDPRNPSDRVYSTTYDFGTSEAPLHISPPSSTLSGYDSRLQSPANPRRTISSPTKPPPLRDNRPFRAHGWAEYLLPDESLYYAHRTYQVVTDVDLGDERLLDAVTAYLEDHDDTLPSGQELWLRDMGFHERGFAPLRYLVDHETQSVTLDPLRQADLDSNNESHRTRRGCRDDRLDAKYQYWFFMETHPAHIPLPLGAHKGAIGALNWASTDGLLPSHHSAPAPFTRDECQSLIALLQSIDQRGEMPLRTRTVSKILLRIVHWRQSQSRRPDMLFPVDLDRGNSLRRRDHYLPIRSSTFMLTTGVYACLAAAISLSPSRSFMRMASIGIGAVLLSLSPVVSNFVAIAPSGADNRSIVPHRRRDTFAIPDATTESRPPASPLWHVWLWRRLGSRLYRVLIPEPSNVVPTAVADSL